MLVAGQGTAEERPLMGLVAGLRPRSFEAKGKI